MINPSFNYIQEDTIQRTKIFSDWFWSLDESITSKIHSYLENTTNLEKEFETKTRNFYKTQMDEHWDWKNMKCVGDYREMERLSNALEYELENNSEDFENFWIYLGSVYDGIMVDIHLEFFGKNIINFEFAMLPNTEKFPEEKYMKDKRIVNFIKLKKNDTEKLIDKISLHLHNKELKY